MPLIVVRRSAPIGAAALRLCVALTKARTQSVPIVVDDLGIRPVPHVENLHRKSGICSSIGSISSRKDRTASLHLRSSVDISFFHKLKEQRKRIV